MMIVGDQEVEKQMISVRKRKEGDIGQLKLTEVLDLLKRTESIKLLTVSDKG